MTKYNEELYRGERHWKEGEFDVFRSTHWSAPGCHNGCGLVYYVKDGVLDPDIPLIPLGSGKLPIPAILAEADPKLVKWVIVELDNCAIDIYRGIKKSYQYLTKNGLCIGNR